MFHDDAKVRVTFLVNITQLESLLVKIIHSNN